MASFYWFFFLDEFIAFTFEGFELGVEACWSIDYCNGASFVKQPTNVGGFIFVLEVDMIVLGGYEQAIVFYVLFYDF